MRLGVVILPELRRAEFAATWRRAEELGFDHAWTYDHLAWRSLRDSTWFGAVPTLAAAALATRSHPGCVQRPRLPFAVAATGPRGLRLAARHGDAWVTTGDREQGPGVGAAEGARRVRAEIAALEEACAALGRDPATIRRIVLSGPVLDPGLASPAAFEETLGRYAEAGVTDWVVHWPRASEPYACDVARFERIVATRRVQA